MDNQLDPVFFMVPTPHAGLGIKLTALTLQCISVPPDGSLATRSLCRETGAMAISARKEYLRCFSGSEVEGGTAGHECTHAQASTPGCCSPERLLPFPHGSARRAPRCSHPRLLSHPPDPSCPNLINGKQHLILVGVSFAAGHQLSAPCKGRILCLACVKCSIHINQARPVAVFKLEQAQ